MLHVITATWLLLATTALSNNPPPRNRTVTLDGNARMYEVTVVGWPAVTTSVRLGDSFEVFNVQCGSCLEVEPGKAPPENTNKSRWIIEKRPHDRSISLRPAVFPRPARVDAAGQREEAIPNYSFRTNVVVSLDGGVVLNITLRLREVDEVDDDGNVIAPDGVVDVILPQRARYADKVAAAREEAFRDANEQLQGKLDDFLLTQFGGEVRCRNIVFPMPERQDKAVVRVHHLCSSDGGDKRLYWAKFEVRNRGNSVLALKEAKIEPEGAVLVQDDQMTSEDDDEGTASQWARTHFKLTKRSLDFGDRAEGVVRFFAKKSDPIPARWRLTVSPHANGDRQDIVVERLVF